MNYKFIGGDKDFYFRYENLLDDKNLNHNYLNFLGKKIMEALKKRLVEAGVDDRVIWLGQVSAEDRHRWFQRIVLCVAPPRYEGFGLTPIEAMSCGAAVVATRTGVFPTLIKDDEVGHLVDIGDIKSLRNAIDHCLADPEQTISKGKSGRQHVCRYYDIRQEAKAIEAVYEKTLIGDSST